MMAGSIAFRYKPLFVFALLLISSCALTGGSPAHSPSALVFVPGKHQPFNGCVMGFTDSPGLAQRSYTAANSLQMDGFWGVNGVLHANPAHVNALAVGQEEEVYVGGNFLAQNAAGGVTNLARFKAIKLADGTWVQGLRLDEQFRPKLISDLEPRGSVTALAVQPDGKIIVAGNLYDNPRNLAEQVALTRINRDGTWDRTFFATTRILGVTQQSYDDVPKHVLIQSDGKSSSLVGSPGSKVYP